MTISIDDLGPQNWQARTAVGVKSEDEFKQKVRLLQSYYRCMIKEECSNAWEGQDTRKWGHFIRGGQISGKNFIMAETFEYAKKRFNQRIYSESTYDEHHFFNNLASSQTMCFNLFHPLLLMNVENESSVLNVFQSLLPQLKLKKILEITLEYIPTPYKRYFDDGTALDAVIACLNKEGEKVLIAVEIKYTEGFSVSSSVFNKQRFVFAHNRGYFNLPEQDLMNISSSQICRNFLLTEKIASIDGYGDSISVIIAPKERDFLVNEPVTRFKQNLDSKYQYKIQKIDLEKFVETIKEFSSDRFLKWIETFYNRYVNLSIIEPYFNEMKRTKR